VKASHKHGNELLGSMLGDSWVAKRLMASQEGLRSVELVSQWNIESFQSAVFQEFRLQCSKLWHHEDGEVITVVSKEPAAYFLIYV
jgi:hypothetical protein